MAFGDLNDPITIGVIALAVIVAIIACIALIFSMRKRTEKPKPPPKQPETKLDVTGLPFRISKSIQTNDASQAKDELRILDLERDILSDALRRLYEAHAEGKITEQERDRLAATYKARMSTVKESIAKDETIVALHELEGMQEDLMKLFSERFSELTSKVEELRSRIDVKPLKEIRIELPTIPPDIEESEETGEEGEEATEEEGGPEKPRKKRKPPTEKPTAKTEAEKRIDEIRSEVEKVLDKLGQMEVET